MGYEPMPFVKGVRYLELSLLHFRYCVIVVIGPADDVIKVLKALEHEETHIGFAATCFEDSKGVTFCTAKSWPVIALPSVPRTPEQIGTLAHEATHAVQDVFNQINATSDEYGKEIYCQMVGAIVEMTLRWVRESGIEWRKP